MGGFGSRGKLSTFVGAGLKARAHYKLMHCTDTRFVKQFPQQEMQQFPKQEMQQFPQPEMQQFSQQEIKGQSAL